MVERRYRVKWRCKTSGHIDGHEMLLTREIAENVCDARNRTMPLSETFIVECDEDGNEIEEVKK